MTWFYLLKSDELQEIIDRREKFLERYSVGNKTQNVSLRDYYNLPKELRFIGPLQPLGELRAEKWLSGDHSLLYENARTYREIDEIYLFLYLNFEFRESVKTFVYNLDFEEDKYYKGNIVSLPDVDMEIEVSYYLRFPRLKVKGDKYEFALMDFVEIYNKPNRKYKNLRVEFFVDAEDYLDVEVDDEYFIKQILDSEIGQEHVKIKLNKNRPDFVVMPKNVKLNKNIMNVLRGLNL